MSRSALAASIGAIILLAGCSSDPGGDASPTADVDSTTVAEGSIDPGDVGNQDDPFCASARESVEVSNELVGTTDDLTELMSDPNFLTGSDPTALNEWGATMVDLSEQTLEFYEIGVAETDGEPVNADFVALRDFVTMYTMTLAQTAASAASPMEFVTDMGELFTSEEAIAVVEAAPAAATAVGEYTMERCDITG